MLAVSSTFESHSRTLSHAMSPPPRRTPEDSMSILSGEGQLELDERLSSSRCCKNLCTLRGFGRAQAKAGVLESSHEPQQATSPNPHQTPCHRHLPFPPSCIQQV